MAGRGLRRAAGGASHCTRIAATQLQIHRVAADALRLSNASGIAVVRRGTLQQLLALILQLRRQLSGATAHHAAQLMEGEAELLLLRMAQQQLLMALLILADVAAAAAHLEEIALAAKRLEWVAAGTA